MLAFQTPVDNSGQIVDALLAKGEAVLGGQVEHGDVLEVGRIARLTNRLLVLEHKTEDSIAVQACSVLAELETVVALPRAGLGVAFVAIPGDGLQVIGVVGVLDADALTESQSVGAHAKDGLAEGDVVVACDGRDLRKLPVPCPQVLLRGPEGSTAILTVQRDGERRTVYAPRACSSAQCGLENCIRARRNSAQS